MLTYTWVIQKLDCYPQQDGYTDVVFNIYWQLNASDGQYNASVYGSTFTAYTDGEPFTPYEYLTQEQVVGWVVEGLGPDRVAQLEAVLAQNIAAQVNPPVVSPPLPWASGSGA